MTSYSDSHAIPPASIGELLTAVPAFLGFVPERSVVLLVHDEVTGRIGATARTDLGLTRAGKLRVDCRKHLAYAIDMLRRQGADRLFCIVIDDRPLGGVMPALVAAVESQLSDDIDPDGDIVLADVFQVTVIAQGARWLCRHGESGLIADPQTCPEALSAAVDGRPVRASRSEMVAQIAEVGRGIAIDECLDAAAAEFDGDPTELLGAVLAAVIALGARTVPLSDADVSLLGGALLHTEVRDAALGLGLTVVADEAREFFAELARRLRGTPRAAAATLVAACAYTRGDGPLTGIALDAALAADHRYRAALLLASAFEHGMSPQQMSLAAQSGERVARRLGFELPPRADDFPIAG